MSKNIKLIDLAYNNNFYYYPRWIEAGIKHSFFNQQYNFNLANRQNAREQFIKEQGVANLILLNQNHTDHFLEFSQEELATTTLSDWKEPADALIIKNITKFSNIGLGIMTADCLPILIYSPKVVAVIHSGWQGLQIEITNKVLARMKELGVKNFQLLVGPHAGKERYEFKQNELDLIGPNAVYQERQGKYYLNMLETLAKQINSFSIELISSKICTISTLDFSSYRRQSNESGRNLSLMLI